jgi:hypothetical protein
VGAVEEAAWKIFFEGRGASEDAVEFNGGAWGSSGDFEGLGGGRLGTEGQQ